MAVWAERRLLELCGGGCHLPLGAVVRQDGEEWTLDAFWGFELPDDKAESVQIKLRSANLHNLISEGYAQIKQAELNAREAKLRKKTDRKRSLMITRSKQQSQNLITRMATSGTQVIPYPVNKLVPFENPDGWDQIKYSLDKYDILIFTSANAVNFFSDLLTKHNIDRDVLKNKLIAAVGEKTAMETINFKAKKVIVSPVATGEELANYLTSVYFKRPLNALLPISAKGSTKLEIILREHGWSVDRMNLYDSVREEKQNLPQIDTNQITHICFTSPLTVEYTSSYIEIPENWLIISIGPKTSDKLKSSGYRVDWELPNSDLEWLWRVI
jgi:uroporphyrinogen-III synthase